MVNAPIFNLFFTKKPFPPARPYSFHYMGQEWFLEQQKGKVQSIKRKDSGFSSIGAIPVTKLDLMKTKLISSFTFSKALSPPLTNILLT